MTENDVLEFMSTDVIEMAPLKRRHFDRGYLSLDKIDIQSGLRLDNNMTNYSEADSELFDIANFNN
jgi:hypothetical protein|tara:strand:- start:328 stop:525 length:198 start_codon:yes stop_codon:yes gene_type:complete